MTCHGRLSPVSLNVKSRASRPWHLMKIALVILHADPTRGGAERYTVDLAAALAARGQDVTLIAGSFAGGSEKRCQALFSVHRLRISAATRLGHYLKFLNALDKHLD